jgi:hypothetical protein
MQAFAMHFHHSHDILTHAVAALAHFVGWLV